MSARPLRFAVIAEHQSLSNAHIKAVEALIATGDAICVAVIDAPASEPDSMDRFADLLLTPPACLRPAPLPPWLLELPCLSAGNGKAVAALQADFILCCSRTLALNPSLFDAARYGVWAWFFGDRALYDSTPPAFWEFYRGSEYIPITLECLGTERRVLQRGFTNVDLTSFSVTRETAALATADFPALTVRYFHLHQALPAIAAPVASAAPRPGRRHILAAAARTCWKWVSFQITAIFLWEMWNVGVARAPIEDFLDPSRRPEIDWLPRFRDERFIADPFPVGRGQGLDILVEEFDYQRNQGYITVVRYPLQAEGSPAGHLLIDEGVHMSYPFAIACDGQLYCIPECQQNGRVALYRYQPEQRRSSYHQTLIDNFAALDSSIVQYQGRWYLFCTSFHDFRDTKLYIWHADSLFGPWQPHALNPVKCDVRSSRPGGTFFEHNGALYRPAQNSSKSYGGALAINRITRLSAVDFEEEAVVHLAPESGFWRDGFHTLSSAGGNFTVVDGKRMALTPSLAGRRLKHKLGRLVGLFRRGSPVTETNA